MQTYDIAIVGSGVFGAWTAWHLRRAGLSVLLVDAWGAGHTRSSSGDESRVIRMGYGRDSIYTRMAVRSLELWRALGRSIFHPTGMLWIARAGDEYSRATERTLAECGVPFEMLSAGELERRYPQMRVPGAYAIFEPGSGALMARRGVAAVVQDAVQQGVEFRLEAIAPPQAGQVRTLSGEKLEAGAFIFACGAWLPKLFPALLGNRIFPTRQEVFYFAPPAGDRRFTPDCLPVWIDFTDPRGPYGFPDIESRGFKLALDLHGPEFDPDTGDRRPTGEGLAEARRFLAERFPDLRDAALAESRVCQYENTWNGDFLIDRHPEFRHFWLAGGGSGHGFKHGPAVGEYLKERILETRAAEPRFSVATKQLIQNRMVY